MLKDGTRKVLVVPVLSTKSMNDKIFNFKSQNTNTIFFRWWMGDRRGKTEK